MEQRLVLPLDVVGIGGDAEQQSGVALNVPQETGDRGRGPVGVFDDPRDIRHGERLAVAVLHHADIGHDGRDS